MQQSAQPATEAQPQPIQAQNSLSVRATGDTTVFVTKTGTKYHRDGCSSLSKSRIPITLKEAAAKYGACSICKPPILQGAEPAQPPAGQPKQHDPVVYVTTTGTKYHRDGCSSLSKSKIAIRLSEAAKKHSPCSICKPPVIATPSTVLSPIDAITLKATALVTQRGV